MFMNLYFSIDADEQYCLLLEQWAFVRIDHCAASVYHAWHFSFSSS